MLKIYNSLSGKKENFKPLRDKEVKIYSCGPTVYDYMHVGNLRAFIFADLLKRYLQYSGYKVKQIMNITDIDDKLIKKAGGDKKKLKEITEKYEKAFLEDIKKVNIVPADKYPRATEHIKEMVELIKKLMKKGYAYKTDDGIYFSVSKFKNYGNFSGLKLKNLRENAQGRLEDNYEKEEARDFALWKFWKKEDGNIFWDTEIGKGRPGWHIECSAMSMKYLGESFDIHTGGVDLKFPHHTNEIAQSEAVTGKKAVKYWVHNEHLVVEGKKMSKSLGNFFTLRDLEEKGYKESEIRYLLISVNYRQKLNLTFSGLDAGKEAVNRIKEFVINCKDKKDSSKIEGLIKKYEEEFKKYMDDDLNISSALSCMFNFIRDAYKSGAGVNAGKFILKINKILGLNLEEKEKIPEDVMQLVSRREAARKSREWDKADKLRDDIRKRGYQVDDTGDGARVKRV